jgi:putative transposase
MGSAMIERGGSERRAGEVLGRSRATSRYPPRPAPKRRPDEQQLREQMVAWAHKHRRFGYRRVAALLRREGELSNHKRVYRIGRAARLILPRRGKKRIKPTAAPPALPHQAL